MDIVVLRSFAEGFGLATEQLVWLRNTFPLFRLVLYVADANARARRCYERNNYRDVVRMTPEHEFFRPVDPNPYTCMARL